MRKYHVSTATGLGLVLVLELRWGTPISRYVMRLSKDRPFCIAVLSPITPSVLTTYFLLFLINLKKLQMAAEFSNKKLKLPNFVHFHTHRPPLFRSITQ